MLLSQRCPYVTHDVAIWVSWLGNTSYDVLLTEIQRCFDVALLLWQRHIGCFAVITTLQRTLKDVAATLQRHLFHVISTSVQRWYAVVTTLSLRHTWRCYLGLVTRKYNLWRLSHRDTTLFWRCTAVVATSYWLFCRHYNIAKDIKRRCGHVATTPFPRHRNICSTLVCWCHNVVLTSHMTLLFGSRDSEIQLRTSFLLRYNVVLTLHCCCGNVILVVLSSLQHCKGH